jgi:hypothetical protein
MRSESQPLRTALLAAGVLLATAGDADAFCRTTTTPGPSTAEDGCATQGLPLYHPSTCFPYRLLTRDSAIVPNATLRGARACVHGMDAAAGRYRDLRAGHLGDRARGRRRRGDRLLPAGRGRAERLRCASDVDPRNGRRGHPRSLDRDVQRDDGRDLRRRPRGEPDREVVVRGHASGRRVRSREHADPRGRSCLRARPLLRSRSDDVRLVPTRLRRYAYDLGRRRRRALRDLPEPRATCDGHGRDRGDRVQPRGGRARRGGLRAPSRERLRDVRACAGERGSGGVGARGLRRRLRRRHAATPCATGTWC